jgi:tetratricopeptide (TPR) repeat protein
MKGFWAYLLIIALLLFIVWTWAWPRFHLDSATEKQLTEAYSSYTKGERGTTVAERKTDFNQALQDYTTLESTNNPRFGNGVLYENIGNTYFQLGEYPRAVLYYYRALSLRPGDEEILRNLSLAQSRLNLSNKESTHPFRDFLYFHSHFSLPQRLQFFFISALILLILCSLFVWYRRIWMKYGIFIFGFIALIFLMSVGYSRYLEPIQAILVNSTSLYRDAGMQYAKVIPKPQPAGMKVEILDTRDEGHWVKISTPEGNVGYVPVDSIQAI